MKLNWASRRFNMFLFSLICFIYFVLLDFLSFIFSIRLCGRLSSLTSDNFECGFYTILTSALRYRFNYWMIIINYCIFEQELILAFLWIISITINIKSNYLCCLLISIPFIEVVLILVTLRSSLIIYYTLCYYYD